MSDVLALAEAINNLAEAFRGGAAAPSSLVAAARGADARGREALAGDTDTRASKGDTGGEAPARRTRGPNKPKDEPVKEEPKDETPTFDEIKNLVADVAEKFDRPAILKIFGRFENEDGEKVARAGELKEEDYFDFAAACRKKLDEE